MTLKKLTIISAVVGLSAAAAALAQDPQPAAPPATYASLADLEVPVVAGDITDHPYRILGEVTAEVRKATVFSSAPSQRKVYRELWERASRLGADAVVNAQYGDARITALSWGSRRATGQAVKFLTDEEVAAGATPAQ
jgi:uncharacterized protein YbjQ (UPF0145 family)